MWTRCFLCARETNPFLYHLVRFEKTCNIFVLNICVVKLPICVYTRVVVLSLYSFIRTKKWIFKSKNISLKNEIRKEILLSDMKNWLMWRVTLCFVYISRQHITSSSLFWHLSHLPPCVSDKLIIFIFLFLWAKTIILLLDEYCNIVGAIEYMI